MSETLWAQVARDLTAGIASGRFPVGSTLPTELDLCAHYGASRHTVRTAIRQLQDRGLISRNKKAGTRVEATVATSGYRQSLASVEDLIQFGAAHVRRVQETAEVTADADLAADLGCEPGTRWFRISSLRLDGRPGGAPVGWTDVYVDPSYAELGEVVRASPDVLISTLIEQRYGRRSVEIRQDVDAVTLPAARAAVLEAAAETPALRILRHYLDEAGAVFEISSTIHPAGRFTVSQRMRRMTGAARAG
ncbi:putative fructoselysine utilization operon transcriptional repressor [Methylobacterium crusticola]|uniref:Fructoselysine utilization operon transcriptional repressor n=1 Tax=Methylobacterium crusticola TaxID=1697972 RepID=A0ABQ4RAI8_9HYPH|nr:GntR family transcriptional regulator [Methylobacterium crusticola]GJD53781.1 putative fructoselysine utilization operon transcriptional repressor [Methylobacterium crusticola]